MPEQNQHLRNFSIIAHIDHGKSTLSDRLLEKTGTVTAREAQDQFLDNMELERERGITIKAQSVRMNFRSQRDGKDYVLNLIDTPGHVDFAYEVSRSLSACEGAVLVVDASQGEEAQTLANVYLALEHDLAVVPVINKIDLPSADVEGTRKEIEEVIGLDASRAVSASAKEGIGIDELLEEIVRIVPPPKGDPAAPLKALIFDSWYDSYRGVIMLVRIVEGTVKPRQKIQFMSNKRTYEVSEVGVFAPKARGKAELIAGEVGFVVANVKVIQDAKVGDTLTDADNPTDKPVPGFKEIKPMVFSGIFPVDSADYENTRDALEKLRLNDSAFTYEPETSQALGFGFRCGYLGLLHMEIVQERLEREFTLELLVTAPSVRYRVHKTNGEVIEIDSPARLPDPGSIETIEEPIITATILTNDEFVGPILKLCEEKRGIQKSLNYITTTRVMIQYELPLNEILLDFYDRLKSASKGYASLDYEFTGYWVSPLVKLDVLVNGEPVDALSLIVHKESSFPRGKSLVEKMRKLIPRQMFEVAIQAAIGSRVIARETVKPLRKNVIAKCYGGDISRKRKLLEKQKEGKKRMKRIGKVDIPQEAFLAVLKIGEES